MYLNDVLALRRGIHGFPGLGSAAFLSPTTWNEIQNPNPLYVAASLVKSYIPTWVTAVWPPVSSGFPQWVWDEQPKAEAEAVRKAQEYTAAHAGGKTPDTDISAWITPGGILVLPSESAPSKVYGTTRFRETTYEKIRRLAGKNWSELIKPINFQFPTVSVMKLALPNWSVMYTDVLNRIVPKNPADPAAAYLRLVTIPYLFVPPMIHPYIPLERGSFFVVASSLLTMRAKVDQADATADVMGRSWNYNRLAQEEQLAIIDAAFDTIRDAIDHGTEKDAAFAYYAAYDAADKLLYSLMPKTMSDVMDSGSTWGEIAKGTLTAAAAMVSIVAGGVIAAPIVAAGLLIKDAAEKKAEAAIDNQIDQAINDTLALKKEAEAWEQAAAAVVPDTYVLMVEQTEVGTYGKLEDVSAATITMTTPGDRFEVLLNGKSLGIRIRTSTGSMAVPDDIGVQIYSIARDQMTQFVGQAETEVAKSGGVPWWLIGGGAAAAVASQFL